MLKYLCLVNLLILSQCSVLPQKCGKPLVNVVDTEWRVHGGQDAKRGGVSLADSTHTESECQYH